MNKDFESLREDILSWAESRGIMNASTPEVQMTKTLEECAEALREMQQFPVNVGKLACEYGDILVTLIIGMELAGLRPTHALQAARDKIMARKGKIKDGVFVKDS